MKPRFTITEADALLAMPRPDTKAMTELTEEEKQAIDNRVDALVALLEGASISQVAKLYSIHPKTLRRMLDLCSEPAFNGGINGFAVCMPRTRLVDPQPRDTGIPPQGRAHAMAQLILAIPELGALVAKFKGEVPTRTRTSPSFDRLYADIKRILKAKGLGDGYPLNTRDGGRRALSTFIKRSRERNADQAMAFAAPMALTKWKELADIRPFDEMQFDGHYIDLKDQCVAVPLPDGTYVLAKISGLLLLVELDVGSRACVSWQVVIDASYDQFDLLRTLSAGLTPWHPRDLGDSRMRYLPNAWMPTAMPGLLPRALKLSLDNFSGHLAKHARRTMLHYQLGVYRFGVAGIPQTRAEIEAFFKLIEHKVLRFLAGGFEPETRNRVEQKVSTRTASNYPIFADLLEDFLDVVISTYNVTPHSELHNRSPRESAERYIELGGMPLRSSRTADDARDMRRFRVQVTIRGSNAGDVLPHVNYGYGTYRSDMLNPRTDLIGDKFDGYIEDDDARFLTLLDGRGLPYITLQTLPPYARTPHTLAERKRAAKLKKSNPARWEGIDDMIEAYHADVRECARRLKWAADEVASGAVPHAPIDRPLGTSSGAAQTLAGLPPRGGPVNLRRR
ncbi:hypothetical protein MUU75_01675 [Pseudoxanthomonas mexicana]|uniref:hypothetical protein n=1 Tax=Pseudoxanthomonas mexicana TaxID=128785 RepID=UPI001FD6C486|nr:hypothetical protein [Pseudoxanthomonas mexicana]UOV05465.1 hypothetical protein MUU75_01675 [Pseudoxanthomonas mexicana]